MDYVTFCDRVFSFGVGLSRLICVVVCRSRSCLSWTQKQIPEGSTNFGESQGASEIAALLQVPEPNPPWGQQPKSTAEFSELIKQEKIPKKK
ncbi:hypothetical protein CapIbe_017279 [Capra ibex]